MKKLLALLLITLLGFSQAQTQIRIAGFDGDASQVNQVLDEAVRPMLEEQGADIEIIYEPIPGDFNQYITNALSAGTAPDLFYIDIYWSNGVIDTGAIDPVGDRLPEGYEADFLETIRDAYLVDGQLYGLPKDFNNLVVEYNKDIFDEAGVDYPNEDDTWETFQEKLATVQSELDDTYGMCVVPDFARLGAFAFATGWRPFNEEGRTVLDEDFRRAFEFYTGLVENGAGITQDVVGSPGWTGGCFATDQVAVAIEGLWIAGFLNDQAPNLEYGTTFLPADPETGERGNYIFTNAWALNGSTENKEAALQVMEALLSPEAQRINLSAGTSLPSRTELQDAEYFQEETKAAELARVSLEAAQMDNILPYKFDTYGPRWQEIIDAAMNSVLLGEQTVDEALAEAQENFDALTGHSQ